MNDNSIKNNVTPLASVSTSKNSNINNNLIIDKSFLEEQFKCDICNNLYDSTKYIPFVVKCGHTFCRECIIKTDKLKYNKCPIDSIKNVFNIKTSIRNIKIEFLVKSYLNLLSSQNKNNQIVYIKPEIKKNRSPSIKNISKNINENKIIRGKSINSQIRNNDNFQESQISSYKNSNLKYINKNKSLNQSKKKRNSSINVIEENTYNYYDTLNPVFIDETIEPIPMNDEKSIMSFKEDLNDLLSGKNEIYKKRLVSNNSINNIHKKNSKNINYENEKFFTEKIKDLTKTSPKQFLVTHYTAKMQNSLSRSKDYDIKQFHQLTDDNYKSATIEKNNKLKSIYNYNKDNKFFNNSNNSNNNINNKETTNKRNIKTVFDYIQSNMKKSLALNSTKNKNGNTLLLNKNNSSAEKYIKVRASSKISKKQFENDSKKNNDTEKENENLKIINYNCNNLYLLYNKKKIQDQKNKEITISLNNSQMQFEKNSADTKKINININENVYLSKSPSKQTYHIEHNNKKLTKTYTNKRELKNVRSQTNLINNIAQSNINLVNNNYLTNEDINNFEINEINEIKDNLMKSIKKHIDKPKLKRSKSSNKSVILKQKNLNHKIYVSQNFDLKLKEVISNLKTDYDFLTKQNKLFKKYDDIFLKSLENSFLTEIINNNLNNTHLISLKFLLNNDLFIGLFDSQMKNPIKGILLSSNGDYYEGEFFDGKKEGKGKKIYQNGNEYNGFGNVYEGTWKNGKENGKGVYNFNNGNVYEGEFKDGIISGKGILTTKNGESFKGMFNNGLIYGKGNWKNNKGEKYIGFFMNGKKNGFGKLVNKNGKVIHVGYWKADKFLPNKDFS